MLRYALSVWASIFQQLLRLSGMCCGLPIVRRCMRLRLTFVKEIAKLH